MSTTALQARASRGVQRIARSFRRRVRAPIFLQHEEAECGAASLGTILAYHGRWVSIDELRKECAVSRDGSTALDVAQAAQKYGLTVDAWRKDTHELASIKLPAILFWEFNHFLILEAIGTDRYYLNDPANGRRIVSEETFGRAFTGIVMELQPGPDFIPGGLRRGIFRKAWPWLRDLKKPLVFALFCGFLLAVTGLVPPILLTVFINHVLLSSESYLGPYIAIIAILVAVLMYILTWMQQRSLQRMSTRLSAVQAESMLSHLFKLPGKFFAHRLVGDLTSRVQLIDEVATVMSKEFAVVMIELVMSLLFLAVMVFYDPILAIAILILALSNAALTSLATRRRNDENLQMRHEQARLAGVTAFGLRNAEFLRATAGESDFFGRWTGHQARELTARQKFAELGYLTAALPNLLLLLGATVVFGLGSWRVSTGDISIGTLFGFYFIAVAFLRPMGRFVQSLDAFQTLESALQRIEDTTSTEQDSLLSDRDNSDSQEIATLNGRLKLVGRLEMRNVTFGYRPNDEPLVKDFNLTLEPGQRIALIGSTGSGKSTLLKLATGEYTPWSGEVLFDGLSAQQIPRQVFTSSVAIVDQHIFLYSGTVRDNLTMWNPAVTDAQIVNAVRDASIHTEILTRASGYDSLVAEDGSNFSHGQRQRLEIARALVSEPSLLLLDEATSKLDEVTETKIDLALRRRGCTCLVVAHRLSTIRDCDQIIVLDKGKVAQRGTHDELILDQSGLYYRLIQVA